MLEDDVTFISENLRVEAGPGSFIMMPRGIPHGLCAITAARMLVLSTPASFVDFAIAVSEPAERLTIPPLGPLDQDKIALAAAKYNIEVVGPLPG